MSQEYYRFLARTITAAGRDPAQLRAVIYQFARAQLRRELFKNDNKVSLGEAKHQIAALETAIEQIELEVRNNALLGPPRMGENEVGGATDITDLTVRDKPSGFPPLQRYTPEVLPPLGHLALIPITDTRQELATLPGGGADHSTERARKFRGAFWSTLQLVMAGILAVAIFSSLQNGYVRGLFSRHIQAALARFGWAQNLASRTPTKAALAQARPAANTSAVKSKAPSGVPIPSFFGVYAIANHRLTALGTLPIAVPDPRVQISALISTPSAVTLSDGRLQFVAFRSDLADGAPDHTTVRVVAQVMQVLTFDKQGHAKTSDVHGSWAVRGMAYSMRIAPVDGHPDMILIEPADPHFSFPAGRYALVLKNAAYDFSVAGRITDPAQCLERTDAVDEPVYNECPVP